jgi:hypothetical protein
MEDAPEFRSNVKPNAYLQERRPFAPPPFAFACATPR